MQRVCEGAYATGSTAGHGPGQHDYPTWQHKWTVLLGQSPGIIVTSAWEWPTQEQWRSADVMVFYFWNHDWNAERYQQLDDYQTRGGGVVVFHSATIADKEPEKFHFVKGFHRGIELFGVHRLREHVIKHV